RKWECFYYNCHSLKEGKKKKSPFLGFEKKPKRRWEGFGFFFFSDFGGKKKKTKGKKKRPPPFVIFYF
ncbi:hypothetical protein, partial [Vibrio aestuarianus]|uniref:hypothetical protein n=1 Tax=Vibrio aestuarianus TaxID=28171 RepID=UPI001B34DCFB